MRPTHDDFSRLADGLKQARGSTAQLVETLKQTRRELSLGSDRVQTQRSRRTGSGCRGDSPSGSPAVRSVAGGLVRGLGSAIRSGIRNDFTATLRSMLGLVTRSIGAAASRAAGGGLGGGLLSSLVGGGLSLVLGRLFGKKQRVQVDNTVRAEVLNFPRYTNLDFAANPASRLFGNRAVARGPAFTVSVEYREGAGDIVSAKIATQLDQTNFNEGIV